jgi:drug/metabolite transporter superfamily protein YnfA
MRLAAWITFLAAALLEVGGDAIVRRGLRANSIAWVVLGGAALTAYGLVVNSVKWDFSRLLGVYVGVFALVSVFIGRFAFREQVPATTWCGIGFIVLGGLLIQLGR